MDGTGFLFATPTFLTGLGRTVDLTAALERSSYNVSRTPQEADARAIGADWVVVGEDLAMATQEVTSEPVISRKE